MTCSKNLCSTSSEMKKAEIQIAYQILRRRANEQRFRSEYRITRFQKITSDDLLKEFMLNIIRNEESRNTNCLSDLEKKSKRTKIPQKSFKKESICVACIDVCMYVCMYRCMYVCISIPGL